MALGETARLATVLSLKDGLTPGLGKTLGAVSRFDKGIGRAGKGVGQLAGGVAKAGAVVAGFAVGGLAASAKAAIDWQDAFQGVVKTVDEVDLKAAGLTFDDLGESLRQMAREMPNSAVELAGIAEQAGALGIKAKDIAAFTKQVAILASTTNVTADDAATALGQLQNVIGLTGDEFDNFAAALVDLGNKGASTEAQILEIARRSGGAAKLFGIAKDEMLGWSSAAANLGINEELAGTALQNLFLKALPAFANGTEDLQRVMGKTGAELRRMFKEDAGGAIEDLLRQIGKMPKDKRLGAVTELFGKGSGLTRLVLGLADSIDQNLTPSLETNKQAWANATAAQVEFEKRNATVKSAISRLKNNLVDAAITIGEGFAPALGDAANQLSDFLKSTENRNELKQLGKDIGEAIRSIDWKTVIQGARSFALALKPALAAIIKIAEVIAKLPPEIIGVGGAALLANKVSGGALTSGLGNIFGGLGESLAKSLASKIPLFGSAFVQPVFVTNMVPGAGGVPGATGAAGGAGVTGSVGGALKGAAAVTGGLAVVEGAKQIGDAVAAAISGGDLAKETTVREQLDVARKVAFGPLETLRALPENLAKIPAEIATIGDFLGGRIDIMGHPIVNSVEALKADTISEGIATRQAVTAAGGKIAGDTRSEGSATRTAISGVKTEQAKSLIAFRAGERATLGVTSAVNSKMGAANAKLDALRHKKTSFSTHVNVYTSVSVRDFQKNAKISSRVARTTVRTAS